MATPSKKTKSGSAGATTPARRRGIQKPRARTFRYSENSKPASRAPKDDRTLNRKGPQVELLRPKWTGATPTTVRLLPMFNPENPNGDFDPTRMTCDEFEFSDWSRGLPAAKYVGIDQKFTFISYDPRRVQGEGYDARKENPYNVLYNAIMDAVKEGEAIIRGRDVITAKWAALTVDGPKKAFNSPTKLYFMQGLIYEHDGETYIAGGKPPKGVRDNDLPIIIEMSKTGGEDLAKKLMLLSEDYDGDTDPKYQKQMYKYGDIVDLVDGAFVTFFNPEKHDVTEVLTTSDNVGDAGEVSEEEESDEPVKEEESRSFKGWKTAVQPEFHYVASRKNYKKRADISKYEDVIRERLLWWDDVLYIPPQEELCFWLAQAFRSMPDLLRFGWGDNPEFFTDEVNGVLSNRTQGQGAEIPVDDEELEEEEEVSPGNSRASVAIPDDDDEETVDVTAASEEDSDFDDDEYDEDDVSVEDTAEEEAEPVAEVDDEEDAKEKAAEVAKARAAKRNPGKATGKRKKTPRKKATSK
jgi:hypothetical protein